MQVRLYMEKEMTDVQSGFRKSEGRQNVMVDAHWIIEKGKEY